MALEDKKEYKREEQREDKIEELNKTLYSRSAPDIRTKRRLHFSEPDVNVQTDWQHVPETPEEVELNKKYKDNSMSFLTKILFASFVFFIISLGIGAYLVFNGSNIVSANNVDITINGPVSIAGGEPLSFDLQVSNQNNITLENVDLSIDFPTGTTDVVDSLQELKNVRGNMDNIAPGGVGQRTIKAILYGEENVKKEIKVAVEYSVKGSNATFKKEKTFDILISSSPISIHIDSYKEVNAGQEFELSATLTSNSKEIIKNLLLKASYPFGFTYISSNIKPIADNSTWSIGDIPPSGKKKVTIKGKLEGQDDENRVFRFSTGAFKAGDTKTIGTEFVSTSQEVSIKKPFMSVNIALDGDTDNQNYITSFNHPVKVEVSYFNNLQTSVIAGEIHVKLAGSAFEKGSVAPDQGQYNSAQNEIVWNSITTKDLNNIGAGEGGKVSFTITPRDLSTSQKSVINPDLKLSVSIKGKRNSETNVPESIASTAERRTIIGSNVFLGGQVIRSSGPFANTGVVPPKAEQATTYTVVWTVDNTVNTLSNVQVISSLPSYVKWLGNISPSNESVVYNSVDGTLVWNVGSVSTNTAGSSQRRQVAFQVSLTPSVAQVGQSPVLVNQASLTAQDDFTGDSLKNDLGTLNTRFSTDTTFKDGDERVVN